MTSNNAYQFVVIENSEDNRRMKQMKFDKTSPLRSLLKVFGLAGTLTLALAAFAPDMLNVPQSMRPWLFITFIVWFVLYSSGMFTL
ncbi:MAG: hypothetical protein J0M11_13030 [Anaerolineae bacterium]|jgi:hypothetical protein|nr:hypothetical protein [Anaerolineae bacterium]